MSEQFLTKDLHLAALFYAKAVPFVTINRSGRLCWFVFDDKEQCLKLQQEFFAKTVDVNAKAYADAVRTLKDLVFAVE